MAKKASKSKIILEYVSANPDATWKDAKADLAKKGISSGYFTSQRSKLKGGSPANGAPAKKKRSTSRKAATGRRGASGTTGDLQSAAEFVRGVGGMDAAYTLLARLKEVQV